MWNSKPIIFLDCWSNTRCYLKIPPTMNCYTHFFSILGHFMDRIITLESIVKIIISCSPTKWWGGIIEWLMDFCNDDRSTLPMHIKKLWWKTNFSVFYMQLCLSGASVSPLPQSVEWRTTSTCSVGVGRCFILSYKPRRVAGFPSTSWASVFIFI